jgi:hypothetical protein
MMKNIYFAIGLLCLIGFPHFASAQGPAMRPNQVDPRDTFQIRKSEFKLSKSEFNRIYGKDDSALALIHIIYGDRLLGYITIPVYPLAIMLPAALTKGHSTSDLFIGEGDFRGIGTATAGIFSLTGLYLLMSNSRLHLAKELKYYQLKGYLSEDYHIRVKQRLFRLSRKVHKPKILKQK